MTLTSSGKPLAVDSLHFRLGQSSVQCHLPTWHKSKGRRNDIVMAEHFRKTGRVDGETIRICLSVVAVVQCT